MHDLGILPTFASALAAALVLGFLAHRLALSPIVGYLLAGVLVGPFTPGYVADRAVAQQFAEIGVILLLFGIGLRFQLRELSAVWRVAVPGALIQSTISTFLLSVLLWPLGLGLAAGLVLGLGVSVASTVVMARVLAERRDLHAAIGHLAIGWTVVEDLLTVALLLLLPILFGPAGEHGAGVALGLAGLKVLGLVAVIVVLGRWVIPAALERIARTHQRDLFTLAVLVLAVGIAVGSAEIFGVSMALGAFLAGLAVGRSELAARAAADAVPMRDAFAVLFFVSLGMLFDPWSPVRDPVLLAVVLAVAVVGKPLAALATLRLLGVPVVTAVPVAAALAQMGELSFILGRAARELGILGDAGWNALVATSILSISMNPMIYRWARRVSSSAPKLTPLPASPLPASGPRAVDPKRCILVGGGPVGNIVHGLLTDRGASVTIIELDLDADNAAGADAQSDARHGDVLRPGTLEEAGTAGAGSLILSVELEDAASIIRQAHRLNPTLRVVARCAHLRDAQALKRAGADVVAASEAEIAVALVDALMAGHDVDHEGSADRRAASRRELYDPPERR